MADAAAADACAAADASAAAVARYYGTTLRTRADLKTSVCRCSDAAAPPAAAALLRRVHPDVLARFYGCGSPLPDLLGGRTTLDLGCGAGRDVFVCAQAVGAAGRAVGVDSTAPLLAVAAAHEGWHARAFGYARANTQFLAGSIDALAAAGVAAASVDVVTSNCVLNLLPPARRETALREAHRALKPGGELLICDVVADRRLPAELRRDEELLGECLAGALYRADFVRALRAAGFAAAWIVDSRALAVDDAAVRARIGPAAFTADTVRAFKLEPADVDDGSGAREDYAQTARYRGTIDGHPHAYALARGLVFITGVPTPVDGITARVLAHTRYAAAFAVTPPSAHRGAFKPPTDGGLYYAQPTDDGSSSGGGGGGGGGCKCGIDGSCRDTAEAAGGDDIAYQ